MYLFLFSVRGGERQQGARTRGTGLRWGGLRWGGDGTPWFSVSQTHLLSECPVIPPQKFSSFNPHTRSVITLMMVLMEVAVIPQLK